MRTEYIFHTLLIALDVCASVQYAVRGNLRMMIYWLAAATKNTDAPNPRVEATVARFRGLAADCAAPALRTRQRAVLARLTGIKKTTIKERLRRCWSIERALGVCDE